MYRPSSSAFHESAQEPNALEKIIYGFFLLGYFTLLPMLAVVLTHYAAYAIFANTFYQEPWMMPAILLGGTFLGGVLIRQKMEEDRGGMALFVVAMLGLTAYAFITWYDIQNLGDIYSHLMPNRFKPSLEDYTYSLPAMGIVGMLFFKYFTLRNYG